MTIAPLRGLRKAILRTVPKAKGADQRVVQTVMQGFRATLEDDRFDALVPRINAIEPEWRGFAYEGVGLGLTVFDHLMPWRKSLQAFVRGPGTSYIIPLYIGAGLALGRIGGRRIEKFIARLEHPAFRWMVVDGYGYYKGFFSRQRYLKEQMRPPQLSPYGRRVFDQGLGRAIWFANSEQVEQVTAMLASFPGERQADLWSGAGFACAYAGSPMERQALEAFQQAAGHYQAQMALAGALAAKRRHGFGQITPHTELACQIFCGLTGEHAARIANEALENLPGSGAEIAHKIWRERIEARLAVAAASPARHHSQASFLP